MEHPGSEQRFLAGSSNVVAGGGMQFSRRDFRQPLYFDRKADGYTYFLGAQSKQRYIFPAWSA